MANILISGVSYKSVSPIAPQVYDLTLLDNNGNLFPKVTIAADATAGNVTLNLPEISDINQSWNVEVVITATAVGANKVIVATGGTDKIGSAATIELTALGSSVILTPVSMTEWSALKTA